ncbi:MAG: PDZ domain-containing protein [Candidatus Aureabacteria bacterium]|nr:PDZ domain-containing protein [Candidatus Auribacterota bacterium]
MKRLFKRNPLQKITAVSYLFLLISVFFAFKNRPLDSAPGENFLLCENTETDVVTEEYFLDTRNEKRQDKPKPPAYPDKDKAQNTKSQLNLGFDLRNPELSEKESVFRNFGLMITQVKSGSPADLSGMRKGDIILFADDMKVESSRVIKDAISRIKTEKDITFTSFRGNRTTQAIVSWDPSSSGQGKRPQLGINVRELNNEERLGLSGKMGLFIHHIQEGTPAKNSGILENDVLLFLEDVPASSPEMVKKTFAEYKKHGLVRMTVLRNQKKHHVLVSYKNPESEKDVKRTLPEKTPLKKLPPVHVGAK